MPQIVIPATITLDLSALPFGGGGGNQPPEGPLVRIAQPGTAGETLLSHLQSLQGYPAYPDGSPLPVSAVRRTDGGWDVTP